VEGLDWITALRNDSIKKMVEEHTIQRLKTTHFLISGLTRRSRRKPRWIVCCAHKSVAEEGRRELRVTTDRGLRRAGGLATPSMQNDRHVLQNNKYLLHYDATDRFTHLQLARA